MVRQISAKLPVPKSSLWNLPPRDLEFIATLPRRTDTGTRWHSKFYEELMQGKHTYFSHIKAAFWDLASRHTWLKNKWTWIGLGVCAVITIGWYFQGEQEEQQQGGGSGPPEWYQKLSPQEREAYLLQRLGPEKLRALSQQERQGLGIPPTPSFDYEEALKRQAQQHQTQTQTQQVQGKQPNAEINTNAQQQTDDLED